MVFNEFFLAIVIILIVVYILTKDDDNEDNNNNIKLPNIPNFKFLFVNGKQRLPPNPL